jgi:hypothetical protein
VAFIIDEDFGFGMARMMQPHVHDNRGENIRIFRDEASALDRIAGGAG